MSDYRAFVGAGYDAVVTSSETIFFVLKSIWPGSERGASVLREPNPSTLDTVIQQAYNPRMEFYGALFTSLEIGCIITTEKKKIRHDSSSDF